MEGYFPEVKYSQMVTDRRIPRENICGLLAYSGSHTLHALLLFIGYSQISFVPQKNANIKILENIPPQGIAYAQFLVVQ